MKSLPKTKLKKKINQIITLVLAGSAIDFTITPTYAQTVFTAGDLAIGGSYSNNAGNAIYSWDGHNNTAPIEGAVALGWGHTSHWYTFTLTADSKLDISATRTGTNLNYHPAFSLWKTSGYTNPAASGDGHSYNQVGITTDLPGTAWIARDSGITDFAGYANSGTNGWTNSAGAVIGTGGAGTLSTGSATVSDGSASLVLNNLPAGKYLMAVGGSFACNGANNYAIGTTVTCPPTPNLATRNGNYSLSVNVAAPVPEPEMFWMFGAGLIGINLVGRLKNDRKYRVYA